METFIQQEYLGKALRIDARRIGDDWCVICSGGDRPHVGAASLAQPHASREGNVSATLSSICAYGHKDGDLSGLLARQIAKSTGRSAAVVCGIHYDGLSPAQIGEIVAICQTMCGDLMHRLTAGAPATPKEGRA